MKNRYYRILNIPIKISSNIENILYSLDKVYCSFYCKEPVSRPELEMIVNAKNGHRLNLKDFEIYSVTPSSFDGWDLSSKIWCGKSILNRYVFKIDNPPSNIKLPNGKQLFKIKTRINPAGIKVGWLLQLHFHINLYVLDSFKNIPAIHGGALGWKNKGIIITGSSGSGKSTLTYALAKEGLSFLTDEIILIDISKNQLLPYPISPSFEKDGKDLFKEVSDSFAEDMTFSNKSIKSFINIKKLGIKTVIEPVTPNVIIFPRYMPGKKPNIKEMPKSKAYELLKKNIIMFQKKEEQNISREKTAKLLIDRCNCYELISGQLKETVKLVKEALI